MKGIGIIVIFIFFIWVNAGDIYYDIRDAPFLFYKFGKDFNRQYKNTSDLLEHFAVFVERINVINKANELSPSTTFDINEFADETYEEAQKHFGLKTLNFYTRTYQAFTDSPKLKKFMKQNDMDQIEESKLMEKNIQKLVVGAGVIHYDVRDAPYLFLKFVREHNRQYKDTQDVIEHQVAFVNNLLLINKANAKNPYATYDINNFSDFTDDELKHVNGILQQSQSQERIS